MIIGIEGLNSTGKTSLFERLLAQEHTGGVAEISALLPNTLVFPHSAQEARINEMFIAGIEAMRMQMAEKILHDLGKKRVVLDRSVLSTIVISMANSKMNAWKDGSLPLLQSCLEKCLPLPNLILHLEADAQTQALRHGTRSNELSADWTNSTAYQLQKEFYNKIYIYLQDNRLCRIVRLDANLSAEAVHAHAMASIESHEEGAPADTNGFFKWLIHEVAGA